MTSDTALQIMSLFSGDPRVQADPYPMNRELREAGPVLWAEGSEGGPRWLNRWHVFDYEHVAAVLRDGRFSSRMPQQPRRRRCPGWMT